MAEYDDSGNCLSDFIYMGNRLVAEYRPQESKYYYYASDQINSTRMVTDDSGAIVSSTTFDPFGGIEKAWVSTYDPTLKFSGKEREPANEMDYFGARYYAHTRYRWISPDPVVHKDEAIANSQLWNLYTYCRNNPITFLDLDGKVEVTPRLKIHFVSSDDIARDTKGQSYGGYFRPSSYSISCKAEYINGYWTPRVNIELNMDIYVPNKDDRIFNFQGAMDLPKNQEEALAHEFGHAFIALVQLSQTYLDAQILESMRFKFKPFANAAILGFNINSLSHSLNYLLNSFSYEHVGFTAFPFLDLRKLRRQ